MVFLLFTAYSFHSYLGQCFISRVCILQICSSITSKKVTSVRSGNQWVLWLSWTEPICHKRGMLFADTKSFYLWQKMSLFVEDQYWARSSFISEEKQCLTSVLNLRTNWALHFFGKVRRWALPVLGGCCSMTHVLYHEPDLGCTERSGFILSSPCLLPFLIQWNLLWSQF